MTIIKEKWELEFFHLMTKTANKELRFSKDRTCIWIYCCLDYGAALRQITVLWFIGVSQFRTTLNLHPSVSEGRSRTMC